MERTSVNRNKIIRDTSILGIVANLLIAGVKVALGLLTSSVAIVSEGVNNAGDVLTSVLTMVGTRLAAKHPDAKHPFGYGRLEYLTALVIAVIILVSGVEMLIESVKLIFRPEPLAVSYLALGIVSGSAVLKFALGLYTIAMGRKANSSSGTSTLRASMRSTSNRAPTASTATWLSITRCATGDRSKRNSLTS